MKSNFLKKLFAFGCVGGIGFAVDAGILSLLVNVGGANVYLSRCVSFATAVFVTWFLNRTWVFKQDAHIARDKRREYLSYFTVQSIGALLNLGVFSLLIATHPALQSYPVIPLAFGSAIAMFFNYMGSHFWVFRSRDIET